MSTHEDAGHADAHAHEPPPPPEPKTPMWLPALGLVLFLAAGIWWATAPASAPEPADKAPEAAAPAEPAPTAAPDAGRALAPPPSRREPVLH